MKELYRYRVGDIIAIGSRYNYNYISEIKNESYSGKTDHPQIWINNSLDYKGSNPWKFPNTACLASLSSLNCRDPWLRKINVPDSVNTETLKSMLLSQDRDSRNYAIEIIKQYDNKI